MTNEPLRTAIQEMAREIEAEKGEAGRLTSQALREQDGLLSEIARLRDAMARQGMARIKALMLQSQERYESEALALKERIKTGAREFLSEEKAVQSLRAEIDDLDLAIEKRSRWNEGLALKCQEGQLVKQKATVEAASVGNDSRIREEQTAYLKKKVGDGQLEKQYLAEQITRDDQELKRLKDNEQSLLNELSRLVQERTTIEETIAAQRRQCVCLSERARQRGRDLVKAEKECAHRQRKITALMRDMERLGPRSDEHQRQELQKLLEAASELEKPSADPGAAPVHSDPKPRRAPRGTLIEKIRAYISHA